MAEMSVQSAKSQKGGTIKKNPVSSKSKPDLSPSLDSPVNQIVYLQRTIGNQAVTRLIQSGGLQAKLKIGKHSDIYEKEADSMANKVMSMPEPNQSLVNRHSSLAQRKSTCPECPEKKEIQSKPLAQQITPLIQRETTGEDDEKINPKLMYNQPLQREAVPDDKEEGDLSQVQKQEDDEQKKEKLMAKRGAGNAPEVTPNIESNINAMKRGGQPLSESTRSFFEPRFGADFSQVRVHSDSHAANTAQAINAKAFTTGKDIVFNSGQYSPNTTPGKRLLAHELTHVVQQKRMTELSIQKARLLNYVDSNRNHNPFCLSDSIIEATNEYKAYMNPNLVWQRPPLSMSRVESLLACRLILQEMRKGRLVNWRARAREFAIKAKRQLKSLPTTPPTAHTSAPLPRNPGIPSGSLCRGACGPDCPSTCRNQPDLSLCVPDPTRNYHWLYTYTDVIECGSHQGCREHDACYDRCATDSSPWLCRRGCDRDCISNFNFSDCNNWRTGHGPFDRMLTFSNPPTLNGPFVGSCCQIRR